MRQVGKATRYAGVFRVDEKTHRIRAIGIDQRTGRRRQMERLVEGVSAQQASRLRAEMLEDLQRPVQMVQRVRVGEFAQSWMKSKALALDEAVARTYSDVLEQHVLREFGDRYYDTITKAEVQAWVDRSLGSAWRSIKKSNKRRRSNAGPPRPRRKNEVLKDATKTYLKLPRFRGHR